MQSRVFAIPMDGEPGALEELSVFLRSQKVLSVEKVAVVDHGRHYWSMCVEYLPRHAAYPATSPRRLRPEQAAPGLPRDPQQ